MLCYFLSVETNSTRINVLKLLSDVEQIADGVPDRSRRDGDPIGKGSSLVLGTVLVDTDQGQGGGRQCDRHDEKVTQ